MAMKGFACLVLLGLLAVVAVCESGESSESREDRPDVDSKQRDGVDADLWLCKGKRRGQPCDGGEGRCVWAKRARRMLCVDMNNSKDDDRQSEED